MDNADSDVVKNPKDPYDVGKLGKLGGRPKGYKMPYGLTLKERMKILKEIANNPDSTESEKISAIREMDDQLLSNKVSGDGVKEIQIRFFEEINRKRDLQDFVQENLDAIKTIILELEANTIQTAEISPTKIDVIEDLFK